VRRHSYLNRYNPVNDSSHVKLSDGAKRAWEAYTSREFIGTIPRTQACVSCRMKPLANELRECQNTWRSSVSTKRIKSSADDEVCLFGEEVLIAV